MVLVEVRTTTATVGWTMMIDDLAPPLIGVSSRNSRNPRIFLGGEGRVVDRDRLVGVRPENGRWSEKWI
ncbi:hypothetical protein Hanom_Chr10g00929571 [Helianthus anomalus]